ncbi:MAG: ATP-binding cassette domain-containing protein [Pseudomonadota bacterium]
MSSTIIKINNLVYGYGRRRIFDGIDMTIPQGKITAIMGPSGTGKTTLLKLIAAQLTPQEGTVDFDGDNIHQLSRGKLYTVRKKMGMLFQSGALFTDLSVFDNVAFPIRQQTKLNARIVRNLVLMKLEAVGLRGAADLMPSELSGGMARRVALARAIALDPKVIMYDEPFTGQDPISMGVLVKLIKTLNDAFGLTSIIVSHDVPETASIADQIYLLAGGKVIGQGAVAELEADQTPQVKQFMQGLPDGPVPFHYPCKPMAQEILS